MKNFLTNIIIFNLIIVLASCSSNTPTQDKVVGATVGATAGTALGAASGPSPGPITLVGTGAIVGALIGASYGKPMENIDKQKAYRAIAAGKSARWQNANSKVSYAIIPAKNYTTFQGNPHCRQFTAMQTTPNNNTRKIYRIACKGADENWTLMR